MRFSLPGILCCSLLVLTVQATGTQAADPPVELDLKRVSGYLNDICKIGPRISGTEGMTKQQQLLAEHFRTLGGEVKYQAFDVAHPLNGKPVRMINMVVSWHPQSRDRVLLCCHYDTRPYPDRDPRNPRGVFLGANDGASGVALLMELGHHMKQLKPTYGVDFVFFDGEELVYGANAPNDQYFHGSKYFSRWYATQPPPYRYVYGVLLDMVGDRKLTLYMEKNSLKYAPALTKSIWDAAAKVNVREFIPREKFEVNDDHIPLNEIAKIPTCDIIDFDYPYWHTTQDVPANCSGLSLVKVGEVVTYWLENAPQP